MRSRVARRASLLRAMRETDRGANRATKESRSRPRETGWDFLDGILGVARGGRFSCTSRSEADRREADCGSEWTATRNVFLAATVPWSDWLVDLGKGRG